MLVNQKCGSCNKSLTGGYVANYSGIASPFVNCPKCGAINDNSTYVTEWKLKSLLGRALFVLQHVFSIVLYYGMGAFIGTALIQVYFDLESDGTIILYIIPVSIAFGWIRFFVRLGLAIRASNKRMADVNYVAKLRSMGLTK